MIYELFNFIVLNTWYNKNGDRMNFIEKIEKERYEQFVKNHKKSHFLQSYAWGEFAKKEKKLLPHYVGLENNKKELVAAALLLEKKLPFGFSYFYAPRGYVIDFHDTSLVEEFTKELKKYVKQEKAIFIKIDPDLIYHQETNDGEIISEKDKDIIQSLKKIGYRHLGFTKNFETMQPRYTFRIDFEKEWEKIESGFSKTTKQRIKKAEDLGVEVSIGKKEDIDTFYQLMILTENRKDFITHNERYYESLYEIWNQDNSCNLFLGKVNIDKMVKLEKQTINQLENNLIPLQKESLSKSEKSKKQEMEKRIEKLKKDIEKYKEDKKKYGNVITLSGHFIIEYGNKAWVLYAGNHNILSETYTNYKTYQEHIKYYYDKGIKIYDQFGTIGDLRKENPLLGLHEFKKKFGGDYVEFCGEFDYVLNRPMYFIFTKLVPLYRSMVKNIAKRKGKR